MKSNCGGGGGKHLHPAPLSFFNEIALKHISYANVSLCT